MIFSLLQGDGDIVQKLINVALYLIVIVISLSFHEWGHAFMAHKMGDDTARNMGRMTLNPLAHIDPAGMLMIVLFGFGWAKPVPVNPRNYRKYKLGEFLVSFAGIIMNLILALFAALVFCALYVYEMRTLAASASSPETLISMAGIVIPTALYQFFYLLGVANCALAIFNFLPVYPLDGSHIFILLFGRVLSPKFINWLQKHGQIILYVFLILSYVLSRFAGVHIISDAAGWLFGLMIKLFSLIFGLFI